MFSLLLLLKPSGVFKVCSGKLLLNKSVAAFNGVINNSCFLCDDFILFCCPASSLSCTCVFNYSSYCNRCSVVYTSYRRCSNTLRFSIYTIAVYYALNTSSSSLCVKVRSAASSFYKYIILAYMLTNIDECISLSVDGDYN